MVLGINVSGKRKQTPMGELDLWIPIQTLAEVANTSQEDVRKSLDHLPIFMKESTDWIFRLKNANEAEKLVAALSAFFDKYPGSYAELAADAPVTST
jgi:hypothetical protein